ncbi:trimeric LpxA-like protein, partial [Trichodelitschia bisporula]
PYVKAPVWIDYGTRLRVGSTSFINRGLVVTDSPVAEVRIGERCLLGPGVCLAAVEHPLDPAQRGGPLGAPTYAADIVIEDDCWICAGVTIVGGVTIGRGSTIGAGAVLTKSIPPYSLAVGNPARVIRSLAP